MVKPKLQKKGNPRPKNKAKAKFKMAVLPKHERPYISMPSVQAQPAPGGLNTSGSMLTKAVNVRDRQGWGSIGNQTCVPFIATLEIGVILSAAKTSTVYAATASPGTAVVRQNVPGSWAATAVTANNLFSNITSVRAFRCEGVELTYTPTRNITARDGNWIVSRVRNGDSYSDWPATSTSILAEKRYMTDTEFVIKLSPNTNSAADFIESNNTSVTSPDGLGEFWDSVMLDYQSGSAAPATDTQIGIFQVTYKYCVLPSSSDILSVAAAVPPPVPLGFMDRILNWYRNTNWVKVGVEAVEYASCGFNPACWLKTYANNKR
jgi:hypothetical protein